MKIVKIPKEYFLRFLSCVLYIILVYVYEILIINLTDRTIVPTIPIIICSVFILLLITFGKNSEPNHITGSNKLFFKSKKDTIKSFVTSKREPRLKEKIEELEEEYDLQQKITELEAKVHAEVKMREKYRKMVLNQTDKKD